MKEARYGILVLLSSLLIVLTGCERREILDDYPVGGVQVNLNWNGVTDKLPEGMRIIFYPKDSEGKKVDQYLSVKGGEVLKVVPGRYAVVAYNYDTESIQIRGAESYETIEAFTGLCKFDIPGTEQMVWGPDPLYVVNIEELMIESSDKVLELTYKPTAVVQSHSFKVKAEGLKNVHTMVGIVEGMANHYLLGSGKSKSDASPIYFELEKGDGEIVGTFTTFGAPEIIKTRVEAELVLMKMLLIKIDNTVHKVNIDVTAMVNTPPSSPEEGGTAPPVDIVLPPGEEIVVEDVKPIDPPGGGGGIGGDVGDWGEGEDTELPVT